MGLTRWRPLKMSRTVSQHAQLHQEQCSWLLARILAHYNRFSLSKGFTKALPLRPSVAVQAEIALEQMPHGRPLDTELFSKVLGTHPAFDITYRASHDLHELVCPHPLWRVLLGHLRGPRARSCYSPPSKNIQYHWKSGWVFSQEHEGRELPFASPSTSGSWSTCCWRWKN